MPKWVNDLEMDAALNYIAASTAMHVISTYTQGDSRATVVGNSLANVTMTSGDFTLADGDSSGRKVTVAAKSGVSVTASGTATHVALIDGSVVRAVTTCTSQALTSGNTVNFPAWKWEIGDPT